MAGNRERNFFRVPPFPLRPTYNSPVILTLALGACAILAADGFTGGRLMPAFFVVYPGFGFKEPLDYFRLLSHALGHRDWEHLVANLSVILLVGPIL